MKQHFQRHSTQGVGGGQGQSKGDLPDKEAVNQHGKSAGSKHRQNILSRLTKCLQDNDGDNMVQILQKHPGLIYKIDADLIYYPQWGIFRIFLACQKYLLYQGKKLIFFSSCRDVVQRNLIEWHYFYQKEPKNKEPKKQST